MQPTVTSHFINSASGQSSDWAKAGLTDQQINDLNEIGYTGRLKGIKTSQESYLESISTDILVYRLIPISSNNMEFSDKDLLIKIVIPE